MSERELKIKFTAESQQAEAGISKTAAALGQTEKAAAANTRAMAALHIEALRMNAAFDKISYANARTEAARLNAEFDRAVISMGRAHSEALQINKAYDQQREVARRLSDEIARVNFDKMRTDAVRMKADLDKSAISMGKAHSEALQMNAAFNQQRAAVGGATSSWHSLGSQVLAAAGWAGGIAALATAARAVATEVSEGEASAIRFNRAAKNAGEAGTAAAEGIDDWAEQMLRTRGLGDEMAKDLVSQGLAMRLTIEQAKRLAEVATDVAASLGIDVPSAMKQLALASDGDSRSMAMLARQFNITITDATTFNELLGQIADNTAGAAGDQVDSLRGSIHQLKEELLNFAAGPVAEGANRILGLMRMGNNKIDEAYRKASIQQAQKTGDYAGLGTNDVFNAYAETLEKIPAALANLKAWNKDLAARPGSGYFVQQRDEAREYLEALLETRDAEKAEIERRRTAAAAATANPVSFGVYGPQLEDPEAKAKRLKKAADDAAAEVKARTTAAEQFAQEQLVRDAAAAEAAGQSMTVEMADALGKAADAFERDMIDVAIRLKTRLGDYGATSPVDFSRKRPGGYASGPEPYDAAMLGSLAQVAAAESEFVARRADYYEESDRRIMEAGEERAQAERDAADKYAELLDGEIERGKEAGLSASAAAKADMVAAQAAYAYAQVLVGVAKAVASGDAGGMVGGIGAGMMMYGAGAGQAPLFIAGAGLTMLSEFIGDGKPHTQGGIGRAELRDIFAGAMGGYGDNYTGVRTGNVGNSGGAFQAWAGALAGDKIGGGAEIVAGYFDELAEKTGRLSLTTGEQNDAMGDLIAQVKGLTAAEGEYEAGRLRLLSLDAMSAEQFGATLESMKDSYAQMEERKRLEKEYQDDLDRYLKAPKGSQEELQAKVELGGDRTLLVEQMKKDRADQESWEKEMLEAGITPEDTAALTEGVDGTNAWLELIYGKLGATAAPTATYHSGHYPQPGAHGERIARVLNSEYILRPEQYQRDLDGAARAGANSSGGNAIHINFHGPVYDDRAMIRNVERWAGQGRRVRVGRKGAAA